jgi:hypothetical protein
MSYISSFPDEYTSPADKAKSEYGVAYAKAMLEAYNFYAGNVMDNSRDRAVMLDNLAQGELDLDGIKKLLGYISDDPNEKLESLSYADIEVPNIISRLVANAVGKLSKLKYDISLTPIDPLAIDQQKQFEARAKAYLELKDFLNTIQVPAQEMFDDLDFDAIPEEPDDIMIEAQVNPKINRAMKSEMTIKMLHATNNYVQLQQELAYDAVVHGRIINFLYLDENLVPRERRISTSAFVHSAPSNEAYEDLEYAGHIERISPNQFMREASGYLTPEAIQNVIRTYAPSYDTYAMAQYEAYDGLGRIPVLRFQFLTENTKKYVVKRGKFGNKVFQERSFNFTPEDSELPKYESGQKRLIKNTYTAKYSGTYILDTDLVYGYGLDASALRSNGKMVNERLNYVVYSAFERNGKVVSPLLQLLEPFRMYVVAWNKAKKIIGRGWGGAIEIDFSALESVALGKSGKLWTPRKLMQMFFQEGVLIKKRALNNYGQSNGKSVEQTQVGLTLTDYFNTMSTASQLMKEILGLNDLSDGSTPASRTAVGVMNAAQTNSNMNIDYLFHALVSVYERSSKCILLLAQRSLRSGVDLAGWIPAMGRATAKFFKADMDVALHDFGLIVEQQLSEEMWHRVYNLIDKMVELGEANGGISPDDALFIYQIDNLKQAMELTLVRRKRRMKEAQKIADDAAKRQIEINQSAAKAKSEGDIAAMQEEDKLVRERMMLQRDIDKELIELEVRLRNEGLDITASKRLQGVVNTNASNLVRDVTKVKNQPVKTKQNV